VVRGATAPRYGGRGAGGVIRLFTRDERESGGFVHLEGGSYGALSSSIGAGAAGDTARLTATVNHDEVFDGISHADQENGNSERDGYHGTLGAARFGVAPANGFTLDGSLLYKRSRADNDGPGILVAVGMPVTRHPPHRSRRAELPHRALASDSNAQALCRVRMQDAGLR
jgi:vitamin B12 transporter